MIKKVQQPFTKVKEKMYGNNHKLYKNIFDCFKKTYKYEGGLIGFYRGMKVKNTIVEYIMPTALTLILYSYFSERIKKMFREPSDF